MHSLCVWVCVCVCACVCVRVCTLMHLYADLSRCSCKCMKDHVFMSFYDIPSFCSSPIHSCSAVVRSSVVLQSDQAQWPEPDADSQCGHSLWAYTDVVRGWGWLDPGRHDRLPEQSCWALSLPLWWNLQVDLEPEEWWIHFVNRALCSGGEVGWPWRGSLTRGKWLNLYPLRSGTRWAGLSVRGHGLDEPWWLEWLSLRNTGIRGKDNIYCSTFAKDKKFKHWLKWTNSFWRPKIVITYEINIYTLTSEWG